MSAPAIQFERCGVCREWGPPVLHTHLRIVLPNDGARTFGPYCPTCEGKATAVAKSKGWPVRRLEVRP